MKKLKKYFIVQGIIQIVIAICFICASIVIEATPKEQLISKINIFINLSFSGLLIPSLLLFVLFGIGNLIGAFFSYMRLNIASYLGIFLGIILILFIVFQTAMIGLINFMQPLFFVIGITEAILGLIIYSKLRKQNQEMRYYK